MPKSFARSLIRTSCQSRHIIINQNLLCCLATGSKYVIVVVPIVAVLLASPFQKANVLKYLRHRRNEVRLLQGKHKVDHYSNKCVLLIGSMTIKKPNTDPRSVLHITFGNKDIKIIKGKN